MNSAQLGRAHLAEALRLGQAFHACFRSIEPHPWVWLPSIAQHWLAMVSAYSLEPWTGGSPDYRTHRDLAVQSWGAWLIAYAAEVEKVGPVSGYVATETNDATIARYTAAAFDHYGLPPGNWGLLRSYMLAHQALPPDLIPFDDEANEERWADYAARVGYETTPHVDYPHSEWREDLGAFDDPQWDERQCWAAVAALVLAAHDLGRSLTISATEARTMTTGKSPTTHTTTARRSESAPESKAPQTVAIVLGTGIALALVWILLA